MKTAPEQKIDWHSHPIDLQTRITSSYKNTQNVRRFFESQLGEDFHFSRPFMQWLKENSGKTLADAIQEWRRQHL